MMGSISYEHNYLQSEASTTVTGGTGYVVMGIVTTGCSACSWVE